MYNEKRQKDSASLVRSATRELHQVSTFSPFMQKFKTFTKVTSGASNDKIFWSIRSTSCKRNDVINMVLFPYTLFTIVAVSFLTCVLSQYIFRCISSFSTKLSCLILSAIYTFMQSTIIRMGISTIPIQNSFRVGKFKFLEVGMQYLFSCLVSICEVLLPSRIIRTMTSIKPCTVFLYPLLSILIVTILAYFQHAITTSWVNRKVSLIERFGYVTSFASHLIWRNKRWSIQFSLLIPQWTDFLQAVFTGSSNSILSILRRVERIKRFCSRALGAMFVTKGNSNTMFMFLLFETLFTACLQSIFQRFVSIKEFTSRRESFLAISASLLRYTVHMEEIYLSFVTRPDVSASWAYCIAC